MQFDQLKRREFISLLGGAMTWPLAAGAQPAALPMIGFVRSATLSDVPHFQTGFRQGLNETGFFEARNVVVEYRSAEGRSDRLPGILADLIGRQSALIVANSVAARAAKSVTTTVPILFVYGGDPVKDGLVQSLNRPGGNVTGVTFFSETLGTKRLDLLRQLAPQTQTIALLVSPATPGNEEERADIAAAARTIGQQLLIADVRSDHDIDSAFETFVTRGAGAVLAGSGAFLTSHRERIVELAARHRLPVMAAVREYVSDGGLMSYGTSISDAYRQAGIYAGRILKGEKPAELPVMQPTKFQLVINLKTAKALGLKVPPTLLALANEVIE
jgi:putative ABC transport system substrate-binding protein